MDSDDSGLAFSVVPKNGDCPKEYSARPGETNCFSDLELTDAVPIFCDGKFLRCGWAMYRNVGVEKLRFRRVIALVAGCFLLLQLGAVHIAQARPKTLDAGEVQSLIRGNTVFGFNPSDDSSYAMYHLSDGGVRAELKNVNGDIARSTGKWWVNEDGKLCVDWEHFRWIDSCVVVVRDKEVITFEDENGRIVSFGEIEVGNPDDL
jgi:hypothetical protein